MCSGYYLQPLFFPGEPSAGFKASKSQYTTMPRRGDEALGCAVLDGDLDEVARNRLEFDGFVAETGRKRYEKDLGTDFTAYRNHCLRVMSFTTYFLGKEPSAGVVLTCFDLFFACFCSIEAGHVS